MRAAGRYLTPIARIGVVGVDDRGGGGLEPGNHLSFASGDTVQIAESLEMFRAGVGDQAHRRSREAHQFGHIADAIRAHLDHRAAMQGLQAHQRQRYADVIVEVAVGRQARAPAGQNRGRHALDGGLAVAAAHRHDRDGNIRAPAPPPIAAGRATRPAPRSAAAKPRAPLDRRLRRPHRAPQPPRRTRHRRISARAERRITPPPSACGCRRTPSNRADRRRSAGRRAVLAASLKVRFIAAARSCRCPQMAQRFVPIAEAAARRAVNLIVLMSLAGDEHHVGRAGFVERRGDRFAAIVNHPHAVRLDAIGDAADDLPADLRSVDYRR